MTAVFVAAVVVIVILGQGGLAPFAGALRTDEDAAAAPEIKA
jgi:hypothetical protein